MIFTLLDTLTSASALLDNLSEADFNDVSIIMKDESARNTIASDSGPLKGTTAENLQNRLLKTGLQQNDVKQYVQEVEKGAILVVVKTDKKYEQSATEMLHDHNGRSIKIL